MKRFLFTCGDINGIGPEIVIKTLNQLSKENNSYKYIFLCPENVFHFASQIVKPIFSYKIINDSTLSYDPNEVSIISIGEPKIIPGVPTSESGKIAYNAILFSAELANQKVIHAIITAPISKIAFHKAGIKYPGHTELYAALSDSQDYIMTFLSNEMKASLVTIHTPIRLISSMITKEVLHKVVRLSYSMLINDLGIQNPNIAILGLNPHAGEEGTIGTEEQLVLNHVIADYGFLHGPFSPDAFFANKLYNKYDLIIGMYHDQILIPFKMLNFSTGVNYTAGLPIVRTSPDHGTAYDIAYKGIADESSMHHAYRFAEKIVSNRLANEEKSI